MAREEPDINALIEQLRRTRLEGERIRIEEQQLIDRIARASANRDEAGRAERGRAHHQDTLSEQVNASG